MVNEKKTTMHIYSFSWKVRLLLLGFPLLGIAWTVFGLITFLPSWHTYWGDSLGTTLSGLVCFIVLNYMYHSLGFSRLIVTDDGITYHTLGYRMYTPWQNIECFELFSAYPSTLLHVRQFPGFKLRQKYRVHMKLEEGRHQQLAVMETEWWNPVWSMAPYMRRFPIFEVIVGRNWQKNAFGRDIQDHAP